MICPFAHQLPGPANKVYSSAPTHRKMGACLHEAEYDVTQDEQVLYNALFSGRQASWHFTVTREGFLFQHYPLDATCWHCSWPGNLWLVGIELETTKNRKLTEPQYKVLVKLLKWLAWELDWDGWDWNVGYYGLPHKDASLWEHNEAQRPYTDCQVFSQGIVDVSVFIADLKEEEVPGITEQELKEILAKNKEAEELEQAARGAVAHTAYASVLTALTGHWENLEATLLSIKSEAKRWHRWQGD